MWTASRLEFEDNTVQLFCRASGVPEPTITWYDSLNNTLPDDGDQFSVSVDARMPGGSYRGRLVQVSVVASLVVCVTSVVRC